MPSPSSRAKILVAATPEGYGIVSRALGDAAQLVPAFSSVEAAHRVEEVDLLLCTVQFDESRMLELVSLVMRRFPGVPCICCRVLPTDLPQASLRAAFTAAGNLGAVGFVDLPALEAAEGEGVAFAKLRATVLGELCRRGTRRTERRPGA